MFLYYLPNVAETNLQDAGKFLPNKLPAPLSGVLTDCLRVPEDISLSPVSNGAGPGGTSGTVLAPVSQHFGSPVDVSYRPKTQQWFPVGEKEKPAYWIGVNNAQLPTPQHLERNHVVGGYEIDDASERKWTIVVARAPSSPHGQLPQFYEFDDVTGKMRAILQHTQLATWRLAGQIWNWYNDEAQFRSGDQDGSLPESDQPSAPSQAKPDFEWLAGAALKIMAVNYRVSGAELRILHQLSGPVFSQKQIFAITQCAIGFELLQENAKKKPEEVTTLAPSGSTSTTGESTPDAAPGTSQATLPSG